MKKLFKVIVRILIMAISCLIGALGGIFISDAFLSGKFNSFELACAIFSLVFVFYLSTIVHEGGHLVFGLLSGYGFSSFRIGNLMIIKQDGKIQFRRFSLVGTAGQCLMTPPEEKEGKIPVVLYNLGGVIANLILAVVSAVAYCMCRNYVLPEFISLFCVVVSLFMALTNGIPLNMGGIANDGMNAYHLANNPTAAKAFVRQLDMNAAQARGVKISEMPDEWFILPGDADMQNVHCASIAVFAASRALDRLDTVSAEKDIEALLESDYNIIGLHKNLLKCDLVFAKLVNQGKNADISSILNTELLNFMKAMKKYPSVIRTEYALALIKEEDNEKASRIKVNFEKVAKKYPYTADINSERALLDLTHKTSIIQR